MPLTPIPDGNFLEILKSLNKLNKKHPSELTVREGVAEMGVVQFLNGVAPLYKSNRFFLQDVQINKVEKAAPVETFGESTLYTFDEKARIFSFSGLLLDTQDGSRLDELKDRYRWSTQLQYFYDNYLRGDTLKKKKQYGYITIQKELKFYGYPLQIVFTKNASMEHLQQFQTSWLIIKEEYHNYGETQENQILRKNAKNYENSIEVDLAIRAYEGYLQDEKKIALLQQEYDSLKYGEIPSQLSIEKNSTGEMQALTRETLEFLNEQLTQLNKDIEKLKEMQETRAKKLNSTAVKSMVSENSNYVKWD